MKADIPDHILDSIIDLARREGLSRLILFGSRARGDGWDRSDIDLAFPARDASQYLEFQEGLEEIDTLLKFDLVDMNGFAFSKALEDEIRRDGIIIYESI